jgi:hypothetical protein
MERRAFLGTAAASPGGLFATGAGAAELQPDDVAAALARFRKSIPRGSHFAVVDRHMALR